MAFTPRLNSYGIYGDSKWYSAQNPYFPYFQMPNCTAYAYGRFWELTGQRPVGLCGGGTGNGGEWFTMTSAYTKSNTPVVGSIICCNDPNGQNAGHVAIVEAVDTTNNTITVSQSGWVPDTWSNGKPGLTQLTGVTCNRQNGQILPAVTSDTTKVSTYFWTETLTLASGYRNSWHMQRNYVCQGFIYPDNTGGYVPPTSWYHMETWGYTGWSQDKYENNVMMIYQNLSRAGFCTEAIAAVCGNAENEGELNPGQTEHASHALPSYDLNTGIPTNPYFLPDQSYTWGLGLCGWTQQPNLVLSTAMQTNRAWYDGDLQCELIINAESLGFWNPRHGWNLTWNEFKTNSRNLSPEDLATAWLYQFENPADPEASNPERRADARKWYDYIINVDPGAGGGSIYPATQIKKMPIWAMIRYH